MSQGWSPPAAPQSISAAWFPQQVPGPSTWLLLPTERIPAECCLSSWGRCSLYGKHEKHLEREGSFGLTTKSAVQRAAQRVVRIKRPLFEIKLSPGQNREGNGSFPVSFGHEAEDEYFGRSVLRLLVLYARSFVQNRP